jgi:hypothetical protein
MIRVPIEKIHIPHQISDTFEGKAGLSTHFDITVPESPLLSKEDVP